MKNDVTREMMAKSAGMAGSIAMFNNLTSRPPLKAPRPPRAPWRRRLPAIACATVAAAAAALYAIGAPPFGDAVVSTENALVRGQVVMVGAQVSGYVSHVGVNDFQAVRAGDLLATIDDRAYRQRWDQAAAQLAVQLAALGGAEQRKSAAQAKVELSQTTLRHARGRAGMAQAQAALELARQNWRAASAGRAGIEAAVASAAAALEAAKIDLDNTRITAPADGRLGQVAVRQGTYVKAGTAIMPLVSKEVWIIANVKETQMNRVRIGQPVRFEVDALDGERLDGTVEGISPATGTGMSTLPVDNAGSAYGKATQRIPVRIRIAPHQAAAARLGPGMSVVISIDTSRADGAAPYAGGKSS